MSNSLKIERLENEIAALKEKNENLEINIQKLKDELAFVINYSQDTKKSIFKIRELEEINFDLRTLIARKESEHKLEKRSIEARYDIEINKLKSEIQLINHKYDTMMRYELYINKIEEANRELTDQIKDMEEKYKIGMKEEEKKFEIKLGLIQQKTLNILGESKKNIQNNAMLNMNNSYKLITLQVNELHHQLSEQSAMLEELLKQLNKKEKFIYSLKINISVFKEVEKIIVTQNRRLSKMIKRHLETKRIQGETKFYELESRKFLHILKNEESENDESGLDKENFMSHGDIKHINELKGYNSNYSGGKTCRNWNSNPCEIINRELKRIKLVKMGKIVSLEENLENKNEKKTEKILMNYHDNKFFRKSADNFNTDYFNDFYSSMKENSLENRNHQSKDGNLYIKRNNLRNTFNISKNENKNVKCIENGIKEVIDKGKKKKNKKFLISDSKSSLQNNKEKCQEVKEVKKESNELDKTSKVCIKNEKEFLKIKGKSYNCSSIIDDMNSTTEFGSAFLNNLNSNYQSNLKNFKKYNLCFSENEGINYNKDNKISNINISKKIYDSNEIQEIDPHKNIDVNLVETSKNLNYKSDFQNKRNTYKKGDKIVINSKYFRNNQILDKYEEELMKTSSDAIFNLN